MPLYETGYVAELGNTTVGRGTDAGEGVEPGAPSSFKLQPSCILAGETCRFFLYHPGQSPRVVELLSNQREMALVFVGAKERPPGECFLMRRFFGERYAKLVLPPTSR